jgi:hypothetical protein
MGLQYFDHPERKPTKREMSVEHMLAFLEASPAPGSKRWRLIKVRYIGHDFTAEHISKIRKLIASHSHFTRNEIAKKICKQFGFRQANGNIKLAQTNQILRRMEMDNLITLPLPKKNAHKSIPLYAKPASFVKPSKKLILRTMAIGYSLSPSYKMRIPIGAISDQQISLHQGIIFFWRTNALPCFWRARCSAHRSFA